MNFKLFYIGEAKNMSAEDTKTAEAFIVRQNHTVIGTCNKEQGARVSGLAHLPEPNLQEIYFATDSDSQKVKNIQENPMCELMYIEGCNQVILAGEVEILTDPETKKAKWMDYMIQHFPNGADDTFCVLKFKTLAVRAMIM